MDEFDAIYCVVEDIVVVDDTDLSNFDGKCPNCLEEGAIAVTVREKTNGQS